MRVASFLMALPLFCCFQAAAGDGKDDLKALQGEWIPLYIENGGPDKIVPLTPYSKTFKGNGVLLKLKDVSDKGTFALDPGKNPKTIDITWPATEKDPAEIVLGVYEIAGDRLRVCYAGKDKKRPTSLTPVCDSGQQVCVYKRKRPDAEAQPVGKAAKEIPKELKELQGRWDFVSQEVGGAKLPLIPGVDGGEPQPIPKELADFAKMLQVRVEGDKLIIGIPEVLEEEAYTFTISGKGSPKEIDLVYLDPKTKTNKKCLGIYEIEGDTLRICHASNGEERPTAFATKPGTQQDLMVLKRAK